MSVAQEELDQAFHALANPTRRAVLERLGKGSASVSELAAPFDMALASFLQHLRVLEASGLIATEKRGRVRTVRMRPTNLKRAARWLVAQRDVWEQRLDQLDAYAKSLKDNDDPAT
ncbi:MAG: helix-turn-helix transcriptional regulator [Planctomycetes bacterium]|nr:helix-turn-helix transcriptional regulator [Planctomycetota bacterium]